MPRQKLTDPFVRNVRPDGLKRVLYWDTVVDGLVLQVEPRSGHKSYKLYYRRHGRARWYTIASAGRLGLKEARAEAKRLNAKLTLDPGYDVQSERVAARRALTFSDLASRYVDEHARQRNRSWRQAADLVRRYLVPAWGERPAREVTRGDVRAVFRRLTNEGTPVLANQVVASASAVFAWALREEIGDVTANPCRGVARNPTTSRERVLSDTEVPSFWSALEDVGPPVGVALRMILLTGQRPGEVAAMRWADVDDGWWTLPGMPADGWPGTKNKQTHRVWLSDRRLSQGASTQSLFRCRTLRAGACLDRHGTIS